MEDKNASGDDRLDQDEKSRQKRKGHSKNSSISERDRKIGHRRINEEGQVGEHVPLTVKTLFILFVGFVQKNRDEPAYGLHPAGDP